MEIKTRDEGRRHIRELMADGEAVSSLFVTDYLIRIGPVPVKMAGIGAVATKEAHRMKGYSRRLLEDTMDYLQTKDYDVSMLFGIPNYYSKFGFVSCMAEHLLFIQTNNPRITSLYPTMPGDLVLRPLHTEDIPAVIELYNINHDRRESTCSPLRYPEYFTGFLKGVKHGQQADCFVLEDPKARAGARILGYAAYDRVEPELHVVEIESRDVRFFPALLRECARLAGLRKSEKMIFYLPPDHPFVQFTVDIGAEAVSRYSHDSGGMMRIIHQQSFLKKISQMLRANLDRAGLPFPGTLFFCTELGKTEISLDKSTQKQDFASQKSDLKDIILDIPLERLMQLAVGYRSFESLRIDPCVKIRGDGGAKLMKTIFAQPVPYVPITERF